jgi:hypothetical protein
LPIAGSEAGGGAFNGAVTINRFAMQNGHLVAVGFLRGTITNAAGVVLASGLRPVALPVTLGVGLTLTSAAIPGETARMVPALFTGAAGGRWLDLSGDSAGPLGALVCQVIALLNNVANVVGLLNSILGLLTGLLGGLTGGLGA